LSEALLVPKDSENDFQPNTAAYRGSVSMQQSTDGQQGGSAKFGPDDSRYRAVLEKQFNKRYRAKPDYVRLVSSTEEVRAAVQGNRSFG